MYRHPVEPSHLLLLDAAERAYHHCTLSEGEVECWIENHDLFTVVAFRGTEASSLIGDGGWLDVVNDLRFIPWYDKRTGWAHSGFLKPVRRLLENKLFGKSYLGYDKPIFITGHSKGGAEALIASQILSAAYYPVAGVVTFGAPRVFLKSALWRFDDLPVVQYRNKADLVTKVPLRGFGFRHVQWPLEQLGFYGGLSRVNGMHFIPDYRESMVRDNVGV